MKKYKDEVMKNYKDEVAKLKKQLKSKNKKIAKIKNERIAFEKSIFNKLGQNNVYDYNFARRLTIKMTKQKLVKFKDDQTIITFGRFKNKYISWDKGEFISYLERVYNEKNVEDIRTLNWMKLYVECSEIVDYGTSRFTESEVRYAEEKIREYNSSVLRGISLAKRRKFERMVAEGDYQDAIEYAEDVVGKNTKESNKSLIESILSWKL